MRITPIALALLVGCADTIDTAADPVAEPAELAVETYGPQAAMQGVEARDGYPLVMYCDAVACWPCSWVIQDGELMVQSVDPQAEGGEVTVRWLR